MRRSSSLLTNARRRGALAVVGGAALALAFAAPGDANASHRASVARRPVTIPALQRWSPSRGDWRLGAGTRIVVPHETPVTLRASVQEAQKLAHDLAASLDAPIPVVVDAVAEPGDIEMRLTGPSARLGREGYRLDVGGTLTISAPTATGLFYGGRTVLQLLHQSRSIPSGVARDWPRYPQRGLMVDASRTVYSTSWVLREIRRLAALKLNVLHLHLTDDQRWAITSRAFPDIVGSHPFTVGDIHRILRLAHRDHVTVIPEIEMPGHMAAFLKKHPGLILKPTGLVPPSTSATYTTDKLDITAPAALAAMRRVLEEYLPLFPGKYWDMGTDEYLSPAEYPIFPQLATYAIAKYGAGATPADAIHGFINWVDGIVRSHGKTLRIWNDQVGGTGRVPVNRDVVIEWWDSFSPFGDTVTVSPETLIAHGYRVLNAGWYPNYYTSAIGPVSGKASLPGVYTGWQVNEFDGNEFGKLVSSMQKVPASSPGLLGSALSIWGPLDETAAQTASGIEPHLAVLAQKTWGSPPPATAYSGFTRDARRVGLPS
ncbi:MAG TPA: beta-N-acetylhexosaminidase [Mycobacteriales bacterium]|nr:beta-N-acetylhexosaminidase [Mycobacteriales bacterium]